MKKTYIGIILLTIGILTGCGGAASSGSPAKPLATIAITSANSDTVAKGAVSSQSVSNTGSSAAGGPAKSASLIVDNTQQSSALSLALAHLKKAESLPFPSSSTAKAIAGLPIKLDCATLNPAVASQTTNIVTYDVVDADNSNSLTAGDTISINYTSCKIGTSTITTNGGTTLKLNAYHKSATTPATTSDPDSGSITLGYSNYTIVNTSPAVTTGFNGSMTLSYTYDGSKTSASMTSTSFTASNSAIGSVTYTNFNITASATDAINPGVATFSADMSISMTPTGGTTGTVNISTPTTFSGPVTGNPTAGQMKIDGANGSYITITANSNNTVTIVIFDGTTTTTKTKTWDTI